jgi:hypothetical protein
MSNGMLYPVVKEQKYGFINSQGELVVEPSYDLVGRFSEDRCSVEKFLADDSIQKYIDYRGRQVVCPTRLQGYINSNGQEIIPLKHTLFCSSFSEGLAQYADAIGQLGCIDQWGKFKISPRFKISYEEEVSMQGKRILSITRGFSTADSALLLFIENGFSTCSALIST